MKIVVTAAWPSEHKLVDSRFGRAAYFMLFDTDNKVWECHNNEQNINAAQGAGIQAAQTIINMGAEVLISGAFGPKAQKVLSAGNVACFTFKDASITVNEALQLYLDRNLN